MKRLVIACLLTIGLGGGAYAEDGRVFAPVGIVPGTPTYWNWSGLYFGGQFGMTSGNFNPGNATGSMVAHLLRNTTIESEAGISQLPQLARVSTNGTAFGGFVGFNQQWEDAIIGLEMTYSIGKLAARSTDTIARSYTTSDGYRNDVTLNSAASVTLRDYGTVRARAGHVMGRFLPYAQVSAAIGRADVSRRVSVALSATDVTNVPPLPDINFNAVASESKKDAFLYGMGAGVGLDVAITPHIFLRGEYDYVQFFPFKGMTLGIHSARVGAAVKF